MDRQRAEKVKKAIRMCLSENGCKDKDCPYKHVKTGCYAAVIRDALKVIVELEAQYAAD